MRRRELALRDGSHDCESWRIRKDGKRYWGSTAIGVLYAKDEQTVIGFSVITRDLTEARCTYRKVYVSPDVRRNQRRTRLFSAAAWAGSLSL